MPITRTPTAAPHLPRHGARPRESSLAANQLSTWHVWLSIMSCAAPLTVLCGVVSTMLRVTHIIALPLAFLAVGAVLGLFLPGYLAMARRIVNPGAFYAYVAQGLGRTAGVATGFVALVAYNAMQIAAYGALGTIASTLINGQWPNLHLSWYEIAFAACALTGTLGIFRIKIAGNVLAALLASEIAIVVVCDAVLAFHPYGGHPQLATLNPAHLIHPAPGALLALALLGFVGIEQGAVLQTESRDGRNTVRRATVMALLSIIVLYAGTTFLIGWATGDAHLISRASTDGPALLFNLVSPSVGGALVNIGMALLCTSLLAALIGFHASCARYTFALSRERVIPSPLGRTWSRQGSPLWASLAQSAIGAAAITIWLVTGWDPMVTLFFYVGAFGGLGVMLLFALAALAIVVYFHRHPAGTTVWTRRVLPAAAAVGLTTMVILAVVNYQTLLSPTAPSWLRWTLPGAYLVVFLAGMVRALFIRTRSRETFQRIGLGTEADTGALNQAVTA